MNVIKIINISDINMLLIYYWYIFDLLSIYYWYIVIVLSIWIINCILFTNSYFCSGGIKTPETSYSKAHQWTSLCSNAMKLFSSCLNQYMESNRMYLQENPNMKIGKCIFNQIRTWKQMNVLAIKTKYEKTENSRSIKPIYGNMYNVLPIKSKNETW